MRKISRDNIYNQFARDKHKTIIVVLLLIYVANIVGLVFVYKRIENEANIINQAGRQRMLSQRIAKLSLLHKYGDESLIRATQYPRICSMCFSTFVWIPRCPDFQTPRCRRRWASSQIPT